MRKIARKTVRICIGNGINKWHKNENKIAIRHTQVLHFRTVFFRFSDHFKSHFQIIFEMCPLMAHSTAKVCEIEAWSTHIASWQLFSLEAFVDESVKHDLKSFDVANLLTDPLRTHVRNSRLLFDAIGEGVEKWNEIRELGKEIGEQRHSLSDIVGERHLSGEIVRKETLSEKEKLEGEIGKAAKKKSDPPPKTHHPRHSTAKYSAPAVKDPKRRPKIIWHTDHPAQERIPRCVQEKRCVPTKSQETDVWWSRQGVRQKRANQALRHAFLRDLDHELDRQVAGSDVCNAECFDNAAADLGTIMRESASLSQEKHLSASRESDTIDTTIDTTVTTQSNEYDAISPAVKEDSIQERQSVHRTQLPMSPTVTFLDLIRREQVANEIPKFTFLQEYPEYKKVIEKQSVQFSMGTDKPLPGHVKPRHGKVPYGMNSDYYVFDFEGFYKHTKGDIAADGFHAARWSYLSGRLEELKFLLEF